MHKFELRFYRWSVFIALQIMNTGWLHFDKESKRQIKNIGCEGTTILPTIMCFPLDSCVALMAITYCLDTPISFFAQIHSKY